MLRHLLRREEAGLLLLTPLRFSVGPFSFHAQKPTGQPYRSATVCSRFCSAPSPRSTEPGFLACYFQTPAAGGPVIPNSVVLDLAPHSSRLSHSEIIRHTPSNMKFTASLVLSSAGGWVVLSWPRTDLQDVGLQTEKCMCFFRRGAEPLPPLSVFVGTFACWKTLPL